MKVILFKLLFRSVAAVTALTILFISGLVSLQVGKEFLKKNNQNLELIEAAKEETITRNAQNNSDDIGLFLYYQKFAIVNQIENIAALSPGLKDINPVIKDVTITNLEAQKYASELKNPFYQLLGNMSYNFVLIYFFPLIIIILVFNLISEEKESQRWKIIALHSPNPVKVIGFKLLLRYIIVLKLVIIQLIIAKFYLDLELNYSFLLFSCTAFLYISFWFALCWGIISLNKSGGANLFYGLLAWLFLVILAPATLHSLTQSYFPIPESYNTLLKSRAGYHEKWDLPIEPTIARFHKEYPQFDKYHHPEAKLFSWLWYYAMQHMGDLEAKDDAETLLKKLEDRIHFTQSVGLFLPSIHVQLALNSLTKSDLNNYVNFLKAVEKFHAENRLYYYPKIFESEQVEKENVQARAFTFFEQKTKINSLRILLPLLIAIGLIAVVSGVNFRKIS